MTWKKVIDIVWFIFIWILAVNLIESKSESIIVEIAGNSFGSLALMFLAKMSVERDRY